MKYISCSSSRPPSLLRKAGAVVVAGALAGLTLMFSAVLLTFILVGGTVAGTYLWWKTRELRRQMKHAPPRRATGETEVFKGEVIEGEATIVGVKRDDS